MKGIGIWPVSALGTHIYHFLDSLDLKNEGDIDILLQRLTEWHVLESKSK